MTPNTTVTLYATPFDISNKYVIAADSPGEALGIVSSYPSKVYTDCYWQRDNDFVFRANGNINEVEQYNYCVYMNNGRYNFAFITECDYVNDAMTLVHLAIDPWLNYAGQYVFHDSPMVRCHPPNNDYYCTTDEPFQADVSSFYTTSYAYNNTASRDIATLLLTTVKTSSYSDTSINDYWDGMSALLQSSPETIKAYSQQITPHQSDIAGIIQPSTSVFYSREDMENVVKRFVQNGRISDIVGAYAIPDVISGGLPAGKDIDVLLQPSVFTFDARIHPDGYNIANWNKTKYSPQFNKIYICVCGNVGELPIYRTPWAQAIDPSGVMSYRYSVTLDADGCLTVGPNIASVPLYSVSSPKWDRVGVVGTYANIDTVRKHAIATFGNTIKTASGIMGNMLSLDPGGAIEAGLSGLINQAGIQQSLTETLKGDTINLGSNTTAISAFLRMNEYPVKIFAVGLQQADIMNLERMFGIYGYMMGGRRCSITFKDLPLWKYYQTENAVIEGRKVPQRYLIQIIQRFNSGIFVFNDTASYKDFALATNNHY